MTISFDFDEHRDALRTLHELSADLDHGKITPEVAAKRVVAELTAIAGQQTTMLQQAIAKMAARVQELHALTPQQVQQIADTMRDTAKRFKETDERLAGLFKKIDE